MVHECYYFLAMWYECRNCYALQERNGEATHFRVNEEYRLSSQAISHRRPVSDDCRNVRHLSQFLTPECQKFIDALNTDGRKLAVSDTLITLIRTDISFSLLKTEIICQGRELSLMRGWQSTKHRSARGRGGVVKADSTRTCSNFHGIYFLSQWYANVTNIKVGHMFRVIPVKVILKY